VHPRREHQVLPQLGQTIDVDELLNIVGCSLPKYLLIDAAQVILDTGKPNIPPNKVVPKRPRESQLYQPSSNKPTSPLRKRRHATGWDRATTANPTDERVGG